MSTRFRFNPHKAVEVVVWFAQRQPGITFHTLLKLLFFAEKLHLNRFGRPILGDDYVAMQYGPVASTTYDILKGDPVALEFLGQERPFEVRNQYTVHAKHPASAPQHLSESDVEALEWAFGKYAHLNFRQLTDLTHREPAWVNAEGQFMRYEDFLEDGPDKEALAEEIRAAAPRLVI